MLLVRYLAKSNAALPTRHSWWNFVVAIRTSMSLVAVGACMGDEEFDARKAAEDKVGVNAAAVRKMSTSLRYVR